MKRFFAIIGVLVVACVVVALVVLRVVGLDPHERRPGLWLTGERVTSPVTDWSFTDQYQTVYLQTRTRYLLPHSVTITCVAHGGQLYLTSVFREGSPFPQGKLWTGNVMRDPHVRLKIGDRVYDQILALVTDPAERAAVLESKAKKYPSQRITTTSSVYLFRVLPGSPAA
ncbi:MAG TPA: hypothetical protein VIG07_19000 [Methylomirabilota bacterium]|jgi:hypothetical protein